VTTKANKVRKPKAAAASAAPGRGPVLDPDVTELMTLSSNLQRATGRQLRHLWRTRKLSERGLFIIELVNAGLDRPSRLIEYFDVLPSTITFETDKLVAAGLLVRESDPADRRVVRLSLTDAGRAVHRETTEAINSVLRPQLDSLSREELQAFLATFHKIVDTVRPPKIDKSGPEPAAANEDPEA
jgi:DNA-binding MarR family transcriptional regulator